MKILNTNIMVYVDQVRESLIRGTLQNISVGLKLMANEPNPICTLVQTDKLGWNMNAWRRLTEEGALNQTFLNDQMIRPMKVL